MQRSTKALLVAHIAEFLREAAVLVFVFSLLEPLLRGTLSLGWMLGTVLVAFYLFATGLAVRDRGSRALAREPKRLKGFGDAIL